MNESMCVCLWWWWWWWTMTMTTTTTSTMCIWHISFHDSAIYKYYIHTLHYIYIIKTNQIDRSIIESHMYRYIIIIIIFLSFWLIVCIGSFYIFFFYGTILWKRKKKSERKWHNTLYDQESIWIWWKILSFFFTFFRIISFHLFSLPPCS